MVKMKKAASLLLALLLVFVAAAAPTGQLASAGQISNYAEYSDSGSITYPEAVEALSGLGVLAGYEDNTFRPGRNVTRAEASKIICYILIGTEAADALKSAPSSFNDVAQAHWANPCIEYCASKGIIAGYGDGRFGPGDNVTAAQMAKMLLASIGYGACGEFEGASWMSNTLGKAQSKGIEILTGTRVSDFSAPATREQIAQYTYNALTIPNMVVWDSASGEYKDIGVTLLLKSFGENGGEKPAGYVDPEQYNAEGWSKTYRNELVDGLYYNSCGYAIKESDYRDMLSKRAQIYSQVIVPGMDDYDKIQAIHDWICDNITYNNAFSDHKSTWKPTKSQYQYEHQLGWAGLILGTAVCAGYSDAFKFLLDGLGIECIFIYGQVPSQGGQHAWNLVKLGGSYYHVDNTWDDQESYISYFYFLDSDATISGKTQNEDYREWSRSKFPSCPKDYSFPVVSASVNDPAYGGVEGSFISWGKGQYATVKGTTVYLRAIVRPGCEFDFWEVVSGGAALKSIDSPNTSFAMPNSNVHVKANFKQQGAGPASDSTVPENDPASDTANADHSAAEHAITVSANDAERGTASSTPGAAILGDTVSISAVANEGFEFGHWEVVSGGVTISDENSPDAEFMMQNSDVSVKAHFEILFTSGNK
ncbi:MAG: S-layer homology domain-containing protein [Clostridiales bacterium]|nr:S-layer homology domain-containing protein [Clostridiales bacterium]